MAITNVEVFIRCKPATTPSYPGVAAVKTAIALPGEAWYEGSWNDMNGVTSYTNYSTVYANSPWTSTTWTEDEISNLKAGTKMHRNPYRPQYSPRCTQIWVVVSRSGEADETYRPIDVYSINAIADYPDNDTYYTEVDEVTADEDTTYVWAVNWLGGDVSYLLCGVEAILDTPEVTTDAADDITYTTATLNGTLDEDTGVACTCGFDYGLTAAYGTNVQSAGTYNETEPFDKAITGLVSGETYHCRAWAYNGSLYGYGNDVTFTLLLDTQVPWIDII